MHIHANLCTFMHNIHEKGTGVPTFSAPPFMPTKKFKSLRDPRQAQERVTGQRNKTTNIRALATR